MSDHSQQPPASNSPPAPLMPRWAWPFGAIALAMFIAFAVLRHQPLPTADREEGFQSSLAMERLRTILADGKPHPAGSDETEGHVKTIETMLKAMELEPIEQRFTIAGAMGKPVPLVNIAAIIRGRQGGPATLLTAHHDSTGFGPGAGDDGSGTVCALEIARVLTRDGNRPRRDIIILLVDGEESGLLGALAFVAANPLYEHVGSVVNLDARGAAGPVFTFELGYGEPALVRMMQERVPHPNCTSFAQAVYRHMPNGTDFSVYRALGLPGFNLAFIGDNFRYHDPTDTPENLEEGTVAQMGETALALVRALDAAEPLPKASVPEERAIRDGLRDGRPAAREELRRVWQIEREENPQAYLSLWGATIVRWDQSASAIIAGSLLGMIVLAVLIAWFRGWLTVTRLSLCFGVLVFAIAVGFWMSIGFLAVGPKLQAWLAPSAPPWHLGVFPREPGVWLTGAWSAVFLGGIVTWQLLAPRRDAWSALAMVWLLAGALALLVSLVVPAASPLLVLPLFVAAPLLLLATLVPRRMAGGAAAVAGVLALAAVAFIQLPLERTLHDALGLALRGVGPPWNLPWPAGARASMLLVPFLAILPSRVSRARSADIDDDEA